MQRRQALSLTNIMIIVIIAVAMAPAILGAADAETFPEIRGELNLLHGYPAINPNGSVNVVIECPAGTTAKWQVEPDGVLRRQFTDKGPQEIKFLPFPINYGMISHTLTAVELGGEGEQLDIQILGNVIERGTVLQVRVIGALALLDEGSQDDKLVGVVAGTPFENVRDIEELDLRFPGVTKILESWWVTFKAPRMESYGWVGRHSAMRLIDAASDSYDKQIDPAIAGQ